MAIKAQQSYIKVQDISVSPHIWREIEEVINIAGPVGKAKLIDVTHLRSTGKEYLEGIPDFGQVSLDLNFLGGTALGQILLRNLYINQAPATPCQIFIPDALNTLHHHVFEFNGIFTSWDLDIKTDSATGLKVTIQVSGSIIYVAPGGSPTN